MADYWNAARRVYLSPAKSKGRPALPAALIYLTEAAVDSGIDTVLFMNG